MRALILFVTFVVAGLNSALAQRFPLPLGPKEVKQFYTDTVDTAGVFFTSHSVTNELDTLMVARVSTVKLPKDNRGDLTDFVNNLAAQTVADFVAEMSFSGKSEYLRETYEMTINAFVDDPKWFNTHASYKTQPFGFSEGTNGVWTVQGDIKINETAFYSGGGYGNPYCIVAFDTGEIVKWVEYVDGRYDDASGLDTKISTLTRNGWPDYCWTSKPVADGGMWGNGLTYVYAGHIQGEVLLYDYADLGRSYAALGLPFTISRMYNTVIFWYDEERTQGDEWTVTASADGLTYGYRQLGKSRIALTSEGISVSLTGYTPDTEYVVYAVDSLVSLELTTLGPKNYAGMVKSDKSGNVVFSRPIDPTLPMQFFIVRPYAGASLSVQAKKVP